MAETTDHASTFAVGVASSAVGAGLALLLYRFFSTQRKHPAEPGEEEQVYLNNIAELAARAIITAPHAACPPEHERRHLCDLRAEKLARSLALQGDELMIGTEPRNTIDLNRLASEGTPFQSRLAALLQGSPAVLLDAHSFPPGSHEYGNNDVALLHNLTPHAERFALMVADELTWKGYLVMVMPRHDYDHIVTKVEKHGMPGVLIEVNELLKDPQVTEVAEVINRCRRAYFSEVVKHEFAENPQYNLMPIAWVFYHCDEHTQVGLCGTHPGQLWKHQFKKNLPIMDLRSGRIHGKMRLLPTGINDWEGSTQPIEVWNAAFNPTFRVGRLIGFQLMDGRQVVYTGGASLYTDSTMSRMFAVEHNPAPAIPGVHELRSREEYEELKQRDELVAMYFTSEHCHNCTKLKPKLPTLAGLFSKFVAVDIEDFPEIVQKEGVLSYPKILVYARGRKLDEIRHLNAFVGEIEKTRGVSVSSSETVAAGVSLAGSDAIPSLAALPPEAAALVAAAGPALAN